MRGRVVAGQRASGKRWTETDAREVLEAFARSGMTAEAFAKSRRISSQRIWFWRKRLASAPSASFVAVALPAESVTTRQIEIVSRGVVLRVREDLDVEHLARIVDALGQHTPPC